MSPWSIQETEDAVLFKIKVQPRSSKNQICGLQSDALKIKLTAPPVDGAANAAILRFLAEQLSIPQSALKIISGQTSQHKLIRAEGLKLEQIMERLLPA